MNEVSMNYTCYITHDLTSTPLI